MWGSSVGAVVVVVKPETLKKKKILTELSIIVKIDFYLQDGVNEISSIAMFPISWVSTLASMIKENACSDSGNPMST